jgi:acetyltransferase-like isoleucine patch superfamily enzyme
MRFSFYKKVYNYIFRNIFNFLFSKRFKYFGKKVSIVSPDIIEGEEYISIDDNVSIASMCWLLAHKQDNIDPYLQISQGVTIGRFSHIVALREIIINKNVLIADKVYISDNIHSYKDVNQPIKDQLIEFKGSVVIGENSWIGENVSIIGAKVGRHCVIGANSFVNKDIPDYSIAAGIPAQVIKTISI